MIRASKPASEIQMAVSVNRGRLFKPILEPLRFGNSQIGLVGLRCLGAIQGSGMLASKGSLRTLQP